MLPRKLAAPKTSVLLLGPRGTGKSTWIKSHFPKAPNYNLLNNREAVRLTRNPELLYNETESLPPGSWVVVDEVQKVPALLDEVHRLIADKKLRFILCGSSARKLRRGGSNLLAGRARSMEMFPLVSAEVNYQIPLMHTCRYGMLPMAYTEDRPEDYLRSYAETYLQEEIRAEALTRNIGAFSRFLEVAARQNAQITNVSNISRDGMVARQTVQGYFDLLQDTLMGFWLPAWKLKRATKQIAHPKFYFFDCGVVRALSGRLPFEPSPEELGHLLETFIVNEIRAYLAYSGLRYPIFFWSSPDRVEVDLLCETKKGFVALEIKSAERWDTRFNSGLDRIREELKKNKVQTWGLYTGTRELKSGMNTVFPYISFLKKLWAGEII